MSLKTTFENHMLAYLHIPFCDSKCHYCAFNSYTSMHSFKKTYMDKVAQQLKHELEKFSFKKESFSSFFIGGGTPSTISIKEYEKIFTLLMPYLKKNAEITTEANPNSASYEWLQGMKTLGVTRISFGVQSFFEDKLKFLGRAHNKNQAIIAIENAANIGYKDISLDLMYGTSLDNKERLKKECQLALRLPINHISSYSLTIEQGTPFEKTLHVANDDETLARFFTHTLNNNGFTQYEISNFGVSACKHNLGYWKHEPYLGLGAGAVGFDGKKRYYPHKNIKHYIKEPNFKKVEILTQENLNLEKIFLGLRSIIGIKKDTLLSAQHAKAEFLVAEKKLTYIDNTYYNNDYLLADELALYIS